MLAVKILGAGGHIGRSAAVITLGGSTVLLDCGIQITSRSVVDQFPDLASLFRSPAASASIPPWKRQITSVLPTERRLPLYHSACCDIDLVLITHCHLDHIGALPYLTEILGYRGPVIMTEPTRAQAEILLEDCWLGRRDNATTTFDSCDYESMANDSDHQGHRPQTTADNFFGSIPLTAEHIATCLSRVTSINVHEILRFGTLKVTALPAGHVLGACMFFLECEAKGKGVLYTGDFTTRQSEWLYPGAQIVIPRCPTVLISESTYASQVRESDRSVGRDLCHAVEETIRRGGRVLIPVGAIGKAQDIVSMLCFHWIRYGLTAPIVISPGIMRKAWENMQRHHSWMTTSWDTLPCFVSAMDVQAVLDLPGPVVYLSVPRSLDSGPSRMVLKVWGKDSNNLVLFPGFAMHNTVAHQILKGSRNLIFHDGERFELQARMRYLSLASHADTIALQAYFKYMAPQAAVLVHGEYNGIQRLAVRLRHLLCRPVCTPADNELMIFELPSPQRCGLMLSSEDQTAFVLESLRGHLHRKLLDVDRALRNHKARKKLLHHKLKKPIVGGIDHIVARWTPDLCGLLDRRLRLVTTSLHVLRTDTSAAPALHLPQDKRMKPSCQLASGQKNESKDIAANSDPSEQCPVTTFPLQFTEHYDEQRDIDEIEEGEVF